MSIHLSVCKNFMKVYNVLFFFLLCIKFAKDLTTKKLNANKHFLCILLPSIFIYIRVFCFGFSSNISFRSTFLLGVLLPFFFLAKRLLLLKLFYFLSYLMIHWILFFILSIDLFPFSRISYWVFSLLIVSSSIWLLS